MADPTAFAPPPAPPAPSPTTFCRVMNPSQRAKVLYAGALADRPVRIAPGETAEIELIDALVDRLIDQENLDPEEPGLKVTELGEPPAPPPKPERPPRRPRPARAA